MSTTTLEPVSDQSVGSGWNKNGFSGTYSAALSDGSDTTYASISSNDGSGSVGTLELNLASIPGNVTAITGIQVSLRCKTSSTKNSSEIAVSVGNSSGTTHLGSEVQIGFGTLTTSFSVFTGNPTLNDSTLSDWSSAYLWISPNADGNSNTLSISEASVILTVTLSSGAIYSESGVTGGSVQTSGLVGLTPAFIVGHATIGSRNFW
jgi:hypothetical protein